MSTRTTCSGLETVEFDPDDTLDVTVETPTLDDLADQWGLLADTFAAGVACRTCRFSEHTWDIRRMRRERECAARQPADCPALFPVPAYLRRQAS